MRKTRISLAVRLAAILALLSFCLGPSSLAQARGLPSTSPGPRARAQKGKLAKLDEQVQAKKVGHLTGQIGPEGKIFTEQRNHARWIITDPGLVSSYKNKRVRVKAHIDSPQHAISVVEVRPAGKPINPQPSQQ